MGCKAVQSGLIIPVISVKDDNFNKGIYVSPNFSFLINFGTHFL
jgi:hypothetical protein